MLEIKVLQDMLAPPEEIVELAKLRYLCEDDTSNARNTSVNIIASITS